MMNILKRINLQRLAGIKTILGIDISERRVRIVELEQRGNVFNRYKTTFRVVNHFSHDFSEADSLSEKAEAIKQLLVMHSVETKRAVVSLQSVSVKVIAVTIPLDVQNISEWILEHREKLLKLPLPSSQIAYTYEILRKSETGIETEITFVRSEELETIRRILLQSNVELLGLSAGCRDAFNAFVITNANCTDGEQTLMYIGEPLSSTALFQGGSRAQTSYLAMSDETEIEEALRDIVKSNTGNAFICGERVENNTSSTLRIFEPFGIPSSYTLAIGLALKGFLPEISPANFLTSIEQERAASSLYRLLLQRTVLACGAIVLMLLLMQMVASFYIQSQSNQIDEQLLSAGSDYTEVTLLKRQVHELEDQLNRRGTSDQRSNTSRLLHDIAQVTPKEVWLYKLQLKQEAKETTVQLAGYTKSNEYVAEFVKNLHPLFSNVNLVWSGFSVQPEPLVPGGQGSSPFITFQINAGLKAGRN